MQKGIFCIPSRTIFWIPAFAEMTNRTMCGASAYSSEKTCSGVFRSYQPKPRDIRKLAIPRRT